MEADIKRGPETNHNARNIVVSKTLHSDAMTDFMMSH